MLASTPDASYEQGKRGRLFDAETVLSDRERFVDAARELVAGLDHKVEGALRAHVTKSADRVRAGQGNQWDIAFSQIFGVLFDGTIWLPEPSLHELEAAIQSAKSGDLVDWKVLRKKLFGKMGAKRSR